MMRKKLKRFWLKKRKLNNEPFKIRIDSLDKLFSEIVRKRARGRCERCFKLKDRLECSHFFGRVKKSTRWDLENASGLCFWCHMHFHAFPMDHVEFFKKRLGEKRLLFLTLRANTPKKIDRTLKKIELQYELEKLEKEIEFENKIFGVKAK